MKQTIDAAIQDEVSPGLRLTAALEASDRAYAEAVSQHMSVDAGMRHIIRAIAESMAEGVRE